MNSPTNTKLNPNNLNPNPSINVNHNLASAWLSLATSGGTLVCCALPALFVAIGAGAVLAGMVRTVPGITLLSEYKIAMFCMAAIMLTVSGVLQWRSRNGPCPIGSSPQQAKDCERVRRFSWRVWLASVFIFVIGALFAFVLPALKAASN
jgi:hypothetical protein